MEKLFKIDFIQSKSKKILIQFGKIKLMNFAVLLIGSLMLLISCGEESGPNEPQKDHFEAEGLIIYDPAFQPVFEVFRGVISDTIRMGVGLSDHLKIKFYDSEKKIVNPPDDVEKKLRIIISDTSMLEIYQEANVKWEFHFKGKKAGTTLVEFQILHLDHPDFRTPKIPIVIEDVNVEHKEPVGLHIYEEETLNLVATSQLITANQSNGEIVLNSGTTTGHYVVKFFDIDNVEFQPEVPPFGFSGEVSNSSIFEFLPEGIIEPFSFRIKGLATGNAELKLILLLDSTPQLTFTPITVKVN